jgi:sugar lactone lactonase YvrE
VGEAEILMEGIVFGESPRWHDGRLWFSDWGANQVIALDPDGSHEVVVRVASFPMCIDFLPDGQLLVVDSAQRRLLRREPGGSLVTHADLSGISAKPWNDIVVDDRGFAYVNSIGFDFPGGEFAPGLVVLAAPDGSVRQVAGDVAFPNGMAITADGGTLIVAESYAGRLTAFGIGADGGLGSRRVWAQTPGDHPDGICIDAEGAVWYADVGAGTVCGCARAARCWARSAWTVAPSPACSAGARTRGCSPSASTTADPSRRSPVGRSWRSRRPRRVPGSPDQRIRPADPV